ncbi:uncharacterized protein LOC124457991 [Xenia sp. Carnegie-2017]|uniref:uncharacterized protein LOC124457991 n=1 Tax=Xenia sp. Carnegie-2017 TaxID=2897299 RepID=UPI001F04A306|nr:uncharacterized protein LOC124457991 [Xenia sp. Carnegie-2017]
MVAENTKISLTETDDTVSNFKEINMETSFQSKQLHLVTNYPIIFLPPWSRNQSENDLSRLKERQEEIEETLQRNLNHPFVKNVHVLVNQGSAEKRLNHLGVRNKHKLVICYYEGMPSYRHFLKYVSQRLQNKIIAITNMDVYLGEGFEKLNVTFLTKHNIAYVLTRSGKIEKRCNMSHGIVCERRYVGSHDTYIMNLTNAISDEVLEIMKMDMNIGGIDNRLLWVLKKKMNKKLLNPCHFLKTYHNHCVAIRGSKRYTKLPKEGKSLKCRPSGLYN